MSNIVFNVAKGKVKYYAELPATNDAIKALLLVSAGLVADGTLADYTTVSAMLAGASDEATFTSYARKTCTTVTPAVDNTNDWFTVDLDDITWSSAGGATNNTLAKLVFYYDPDTTSSSDANNIPLTAHDVSLTTDGSTIIAVINAAGIYKAA